MLQYTIFLILAPLAATLSAGVIIYAWRSKTSREITAMLWLVASIMGWLTCNIFELSSPTETGTLLWAKAGYFFVTGTAVDEDTILR